jgi:hypothetical protein
MYQDQDNICGGQVGGALALPVFCEAKFSGVEARRGATKCEASALSAELIPTFLRLRYEALRSFTCGLYYRNVNNQMSRTLL